MSINIRHDTNDISTNTGATPTVGGKVAVTPDINYGFRNRVINGSFRINQRGLTSTANDVYGLDRWYTLTSTGNVTIAQQTLQEDGTPYNIRLTQPDVTAKQLGLATILESSDSLSLRGQAATLSMRLRSSSAQTYNYAILEWTGTADVVTSSFVSVWGTPVTYIANVIEHKGSIALAANTWTDVTALTATIGSTMNNLMVFVWSDATMTQNATLDIGKVQLEAGSNKTPFEHRPMAVEMELCQRYLPAFNSTSTTSNIAGGGVTSTSAASAQYFFKVTPRTPPTGISTTAVSGFSLQEFGIATSVVTALTFSSASNESCTMSVTGTGTPYTVAGPINLFANSATAQILFTGCEL